MFVGVIIDDEQGDEKCDDDRELTIIISDGDVGIRFIRLKVDVTPSQRENGYYACTYARTEW